MAFEPPPLNETTTQKVVAVTRLLSENHGHIAVFISSSSYYLFSIFLQHEHRIFPLLLWFVLIHFLGFLFSHLISMKIGADDVELVRSLLNKDTPCYQARYRPELDICKMVGLGTFWSLLYLIIFFFSSSNIAIAQGMTSMYVTAFSSFAICWCSYKIQKTVYWVSTPESGFPERPVHSKKSALDKLTGRHLITPNPLLARTLLFYKEISLPLVFIIALGGMYLVSKINLNGYLEPMIAAPTFFSFGTLFSVKCAYYIASNRDHKCRILGFRRFGEYQRNAAQKSVAVAAGLCGKAHIVRDPQYLDDYSEIEIAERSNMMIYQMVPIPRRYFCEIEEHKFDKSEWQEKVLKLFEQADLAVVDVSKITRAVRWEIGQCLLRLPPSRIIFIAKYRQWQDLQKMANEDASFPMSKIVRINYFPNFFGYYLLRILLVRQFLKIARNEG